MTATYESSILTVIRENKKLLSVNIILKLVLITIVLVSFICSCSNSESINIPDENLKTELRIFLGKSGGDEITAYDMAGLIGLTIKNDNIINLSGLEYCHNLANLLVYGTQVYDITPISLLDNLTLLNINENNIRGFFKQA